MIKLKAYRVIADDSTEQSSKDLRLRKEWEFTRHDDYRATYLLELDEKDF